MPFLSHLSACLVARCCESHSLPSCNSLKCYQLWLLHAVKYSLILSLVLLTFTGIWNLLSCSPGFRHLKSTYSPQKAVQILCPSSWSENLVNQSPKLRKWKKNPHSLFSCWLSLEHWNTQTLHFVAEIAVAPLPPPVQISQRLVHIHGLS